MKRTILPLFSILALLVVLSCDTKDDAVKRSVVDEYRNVGHQIPTDVGQRWISLYNSKNQTQNRIGLSPYGLDNEELEALRESVDNLTGVAYHYGLDDNGTKHIIAIPLDETLRLWTDIPGRIYVDANTSEVISQEVAASWADNFKNANPNEIWFHYFGQNVVSDILSTSSLTGIDIIPALSDLDLSPQLLLVVNIDILGLGLGRTSGETPIYDASYPCPRCEAQ